MLYFISNDNLTLIVTWNDSFITLPNTPLVQEYAKNPSFSIFMETIGEAISIHAPIYDSIIKNSHKVTLK